MGEYADFNLQLNDTTKRFTYFVPRNSAWQQASRDFPSVHTKLFMPAFSYQVIKIVHLVWSTAFLTYHIFVLQSRQILERHLVVADKVFTMAELRNMGNDSIVLPTLRDALTIRVREDGKRKRMIFNVRKKCDFYRQSRIDRFFYLLEYASHSRLPSGCSMY